MASISTDKAGNRKIQFSDGNGNRSIVRIGKPSMKAAEKILAKIEAILKAKLSCRSLAPDVATWVGEIPDVLAKRLVAENPFADMKGCSVQANKSREHFITSEVADKVLAACPDNEWRLIFALARFGGLRTPSESLLLRWADVW